MKTIKLSRDEANALCTALRNYEGENKELVESARYKIFLEPDDTVMFMELIDSKPNKCEDCGMVTTDLITKSDHHGGIKTVCRNRDFCHSRSY